MTTASVVIPSRGGAARLPLLLNGLRAQEYSDWEAVVVLDGDIDGSAAVVARFGDLPVRTIAFAANRGRVAALNAGFAAATGDILIRCDDDFEVPSGFIGAHVAAHTGVVRGVVGPTRNVAPDNAYMRAYGRDADERAARALQDAAPADLWRFWGGNTSVPRAVHTDLGGFSDAYSGYGWEDLDFGYRLHAAGIPIAVAAETEVKHHMASISTTVRADRAFRSGQARRTFESRHGTDASSATPISVWSRLVGFTAHALSSPTRVGRAAGAVDTLIGAVPIPVGRKAIALVVESASVAGFRAAKAEEVAPGDF